MEFKVEYNYFKKVLEQLGKEFIDELKKELISKGKSATGDLINSLSYKVNLIGEDYYIEIMANDYLKYVDKGRRPGKQPPVNKIIPWVEARGIKFTGKGGKILASKSTAYVISKSIGEKGVKGIFVIDKVRQLVFDRYEQKIKIALKEDYSEYIKKVFSDI